MFATEAASEQYAALRKAVDDAGIPWMLADDDAVASLSGAVTPQGIVAVCRFLDVPPRPLGGRGREWPASVSKPRTLVICADVRDPGNAGTVIRCADAVGRRRRRARRHTASTPTTTRPSARRSAACGTCRSPLHDDPAEVVRRAQAAGFVVLAADGAGETDLFEAETSGLLDGRVAWLFGNEAWGLPDDLAALADHRVSIPIFGRAESLNLVDRGRRLPLRDGARAAAETPGHPTRQIPEFGCPAGE